MGESPENSTGISREILNLATLLFLTILTYLGRDERTLGSSSADAASGLRKYQM
ncbi:MAG: hypothetical protein NO515_07290 [Candidatus Methanomethylicia archaeon]|jgi:hypothetical protein|nr:hypothetical protein [Candidatus Methanomethylicia archaeon]MCQ5374794.1 hypothetical protein [Candidatus Methanomethylicia archaeon]NHV60147.1 hypothetical protein [Candidatus Verstraetearchaeota archaeon]